MTGAVFAVVGPSGAGKDTLIAAARQTRPDLVIVRRVITRPESAGGEDFYGVSEAEFEARRARGEFALHWRAHGLRYGIPQAQVDLRDEGHPVVFNGSRAALERAVEVMPGLRVIRVCAPSAVLMERLLARGRESREEIAERIQRASYDIPAGLPVVDVRNDGSLADGVAQFLAALHPPVSA
ncbi:MAG: phosphonate metabolism protein/1,5-bisphosphokinase (PRPP-forming) PhnN [Rhodobacteraceae bacterium PARR1]|nr:MAG: phosphonate metabolism protein/1,5-bisphosphokinase (PRPP-forming) PhnN [Rhodobacteraceae bacterium PARR1]